VLTGGGSQLSGIGDLAGLILDKQVRIGRPLRVSGLAEATSSAAYATCAGLLLYAIASDIAAPRDLPQQAKEPGNLVGRVGHWFREHF
jgi:cell division protein FtsA